MSIFDKAKDAAQSLVQGAMGVAVARTPDRFIPGGRPDPLIGRQHGHVGKPISRIDGPLKVSGRARFAAEVALDDMAYAAVVFSTIAKGRIVEIDTARAEAAPGVVLVMTHANAPRMAPMPRFLEGPKNGGGDDLPIMQDPLIHWNGQPVAVVLAETQEQADHATSLVRVSYEQAPAITSRAATRAAGGQVDLFIGTPLENHIGNADAALAVAAHCTDHVYTTPMHSHNPIEPHAATVAWIGNELIVHDASQLVSHTAASLAQIFGMAEERVHVSSPYVGGGFGSKCLWQHQVLGAAAAKLAGRPVRIALSREGVYRLVGGRAPTEQRVALGAGNDGRLTALIHEGHSFRSQRAAMTEPFILGTRSAYASDTMRLRVESHGLDMLTTTFMRAPGEAVGTFALESAIEELAETLGIDPIDLRLRNEPEKDPLSGLPFSMRNLAEAYRIGAERFGWQERNPAPGSRREGEWLIGMGCATGTYPYNRMAGGAARITLTTDGAVTVDIAAHEMGMGTATAQTQVIADRLGIQMAQVTFRYGDSTLPGVVLAGGSQQTASIGMAVRTAQEALFAELLKLAGNDSPLAGLDADEVTGIEGGLAAIEAPERHESYASILARAQRDSVSVETESPMPIELQHWSMHSYSAMFCEARINAVTGEIRVPRLVGVFDCGTILNPKTATSQFRGGIIMGLGMALMEETVFDERKGRVLNPSLAEYHIPVHLDVPEIDVLWTGLPDPHAPMGAHGIGEIGITGTAAAITNAVYNATGKRVRDLPITLDKLL